MISIGSNERHTEHLDNNLKIITNVDKSTKWCFISILILKIKYNELNNRHNKPKLPREDRLFNAFRSSK